MDSSGRCCAEMGCGAFDFLPFQCRDCNKSFCDAHRSKYKHSCVATAAAFSGGSASGSASGTSTSAASEGGGGRSVKDMIKQMQGRHDTPSTTTTTASTSASPTNTSTAAPVKRVSIPSIPRSVAQPPVNNTASTIAKLDAISSKTTTTNVSTSTTASATSGTADAGSNAPTTATAPPPSTNPVALKTKQMLIKSKAVGNTSIMESDRFYITVRFARASSSDMYLYFARHAILAEVLESIAKAYTLQAFGTTARPERMALVASTEGVDWHHYDRKMSLFQLFAPFEMITVQPIPVEEVIANQSAIDGSNSTSTSNTYTASPSKSSTNASTTSTAPTTPTATANSSISNTSPVVHPTSATTYTTTNTTTTPPIAVVSASSNVPAMPVFFDLSSLPDVAGFDLPMPSAFPVTSAPPPPNPSGQTTVSSAATTSTSLASTPSATSASNDFPLEGTTDGMFVKGDKVIYKSSVGYTEDYVAIYEEMPATILAVHKEEVPHYYTVGIRDATTGQMREKQTVGTRIKHIRGVTSTSANASSNTSTNASSNTSTNASSNTSTNTTNNRRFSTGSVASPSTTSTTAPSTTTSPATTTSTTSTSTSATSSAPINSSNLMGLRRASTTAVPSTSGTSGGTTSSTAAAGTSIEVAPSTSDSYTITVSFSKQQANFSGISNTLPYTTLENAIKRWLQQSESKKVRLICKGKIIQNAATVGDTNLEPGTKVMVMM